MIRARFDFVLTHAMAAAGGLNLFLGSCEVMKSPCRSSTRPWLPFCSNVFNRKSIASQENCLSNIYENQGRVCNQ